MTLGFEERLGLRRLVSQARLERAKQAMQLADVCPKCNEQFERRRSNQVYCSTECQRADRHQYERWHHKKIPCVNGCGRQVVYKARKTGIRCLPCYHAERRGDPIPPLEEAA